VRYFSCRLLLDFVLIYDFFQLQFQHSVVDFGAVFFVRVCGFR
jgi:hypothetical protein